MKRVVLMPVLVLAAALFAVAPALSQQDMTQVQNAPFPEARRAPAAFAHDAHNEKAKIEDCATCHHGEKNGQIDREADTAGQPCADCHPVKAAPGKTPLMRAFHRQCAGCHMKVNKGPVTCGECHAPK